MDEVDFNFLICKFDITWGGGSFDRQGQVDSGGILLDLKTHLQGAQSGCSSDYL